jgi:hypothetical protein
MIAMKIKCKKEPFAIDVKRLHIPVSITSTCPKCKQDVTADFNRDLYLSYPTFNDEFEVQFECECEDANDDSVISEWSEFVIFSITCKKVNNGD